MLPALTAVTTVASFNSCYKLLAAQSQLQTLLRYLIQSARVNTSNIQQGRDINSKGRQSVTQ